MTGFVLGAVALAAVTVLLLVLPLMRRAERAPGETQSDASVAVLKDQIAELEREHAAGTIGEQAFEAAQKEIRARLIEDTSADAAPGAAPDAAPGATPAARAERAPAIALAVIVPLCAVGLYLLLGTPQALDPQRAPAGMPDPAQIEGMVARLAAKMEQTPDDTQGWLMLARSYRVLGKNAEAARAYSKAESAVAGDARLLTDYAEALALAHEGSLQGKPAELLARAVQLDPKHGPARMLLGAAAFQTQDWTGAIAQWERARSQYAPGSEEARILDDSIARAREYAQGSAPRPLPRQEGEKKK